MIYHFFKQHVILFMPVQITLLRAENQSFFIFEFGIKDALIT